VVPPLLENLDGLLQLGSYAAIASVTQQGFLNPTQATLLAAWRTAKRRRSERLTISIFQHPVAAVVFAIFGP